MTSTSCKISSNETHPKPISDQKIHATSSDKTCQKCVQTNLQTFADKFTQTTVSFDTLLNSNSSNKKSSHFKVETNDTATTYKENGTYVTDLMQNLKIEENKIDQTDKCSSRIMVEGQTRDPNLNPGKENATQPGKGRQEKSGSRAASQSQDQAKETTDIEAETKPACPQPTSCPPGFIIKIHTVAADFKTFIREDYSRWLRFENIPDQYKYKFLKFCFHNKKNVDKIEAICDLYSNNFNKCVDKICGIFPSKLYLNGKNDHPSKISEIQKKNEGAALLGTSGFQTAVKKTPIQGHHFAKNSGFKTPGQNANSGTYKTPLLGSREKTYGEILASNLTVSQTSAKKFSKKDLTTPAKFVGKKGETGEWQKLNTLETTATKSPENDNKLTSNTKNETEKTCSGNFSTGKSHTKNPNSKWPKFNGNPSNFNKNFRSEGSLNNLKEINEDTPRTIGMNSQGRPGSKPNSYISQSHTILSGSNSVNFERLINDSKSIYINNLDYSITKEYLSNIFSAVGHIDRCTIQCDKNTGKSKGFAYIQFASEMSVPAAIENFDGKKLACFRKKEH